MTPESEVCSSKRGAFSGASFVDEGANGYRLLVDYWLTGILIIFF